MKIRVLQWDKDFTNSETIFSGEVERILFKIKPVSMYPTFLCEEEITIAFVKKVQVTQTDYDLIFEHKKKGLKVGSVYTLRAIDMVEWGKTNTEKPLSTKEIMEACKMKYHTLFYRTIKPLIRLGIVTKIGRGIYQFNAQEGESE